MSTRLEEILLEPSFCISLLVKRSGANYVSRYVVRITYRDMWCELRIEVCGANYVSRYVVRITYRGMWCELLIEVCGAKPKVRGVCVMLKAFNIGGNAFVLG
jgi:hypothetical protein